MIAILKIDSADVINRMDSEKFQLRMIPSTKIKLDSEEMKFYEPIFFDDVDIVEEPDPSEYISREQIPAYYWDYIQNCISNNSFPTQEQLNPDNYLFKSDIPTFYWNFSKYALSNPAGISPSSYYNLCDLMQATPKLMNQNYIYNWSKKPSNELRFAYNTSPSITSNDYYFSNGLVTNAYQTINFRGKFQINSILKVDDKTTRRAIVSFYNPSNSSDVNNRVFIEINKNVFSFNIKRSTITGGTCNITLPSTWDVSQNVTIQVDGEWDTNSNQLYIDTSIRYAYDNRITKDINSNVFTANQTPGILIERIGTYIYRNTNATVNSTISGTKHLQEYHSINYNDDTETIIKFDKSKIINEKLMVIV